MSKVKSKAKSAKLIKTKANTQSTKPSKKPTIVTKKLQVSKKSQAKQITKKPTINKKAPTKKIIAAKAIGKKVKAKTTASANKKTSKEKIVANKTVVTKVKNSKSIKKSPTKPQIKPQTKTTKSTPISKKEKPVKATIKPESKKTTNKTTQPIEDTTKNFKTKTSNKTAANDTTKKLKFKVGDYAVYPTHGVGKIIDMEKFTILGKEINSYLMYFDKEKLNIKIPVNSVDVVGLRPLVSKEIMNEVFVILRSGVKKLKGMWSRRAQEYETKINSGDIILLAEVLRDLVRDIDDSDRSYSERIIYETAVYRLASEYAVIYGISFDEAKDTIIITAKDKIGSEDRVLSVKHDGFDDFEYDADEEEEDEEEDDEDEYEDEDEDDKPKRGRKAKD